jgi:TolA-binding protein
MLELSAYSATNSQSKLIEEKLKKSIENVKNFKTKKNNEIKMLNDEIAQLKLTIKKLKRQHRQCQNNKRDTIKHLTRQLTISENNFYILHKENKKLKEDILNRKNTPQSEVVFIKEELINENDAIKPITIQHEWVEVVVKDDINIYELALQYYGKKSEYTQIYRANKDIIPETLKLANGMSLKLPVTHNFRERPFILNQN